MAESGEQPPVQKWALAGLYCRNVQILPCWASKNSFQQSHTCLGAGVREASGDKTGRCQRPTGVHHACLLPVCLPVLPSQLCPGSGSEQPWHLGWWAMSWLQPWCLVKRAHWFLVLKASTFLSGAWERGEEGEREGLKVNKQNHSNDPPSSSSLTWPH